MDCYTTFAAKASKYKNPINDVGVTKVYGIDGPRELEVDTGLTFENEHSMTPENLVNELQGMERRVFRKLYSGKIAQRMYRLPETEVKKISKRDIVFADYGKRGKPFALL